MGQKDITEKALLNYNDVFADIINVLLFGGKQVINPDDLEDQLPLSHYKVRGKFHEMERDVAKRWKRNNIRIAFLGLENETEADRYMSLRVSGYDGTEYRSQLIEMKEHKLDHPYPVITLVLYFGYEKHWDQPTSLYDILDIPDELKPYVNDLKINLFEIAWLTREQVNMFQSDFKVVADYFVQMRENRDYQPSAEELNHINAVIELLNVIEKDCRFEMKMNEDFEKGKVNKMSEWLTRKLDESEDKGRKEGEKIGRKAGEKIGRKEGENRMGNLINTLFDLGRVDDAKRASYDSNYRDQLYQELQIA